MTTIHTLLAMTSVREWSISQLDVENAFFNGEMCEDVYIRSPPGYSISEGMVCHIRHSLCGLKQAHQTRFQYFASMVTTMIFPSALMIRLSSSTCHLVVGLFSFFTWMT
jgi:hypothetical protein